MKDNEYKKIEDWEVLTPTGWQDFKGIKKVTKEHYYNVTYKLPNGEIKNIKCSGGHQLCIKTINNEILFTFVDLLIESDKLLFEDNETFCDIVSIETINENIELFDLVNVANGFEYIANNIVNHNCAHIDGIEDLYLSLRPTLSTGGSIILISSPSGVGTLFHKIWVGSNENKNEHGEGENGYYPIELPWTVHPERDQTWFEKERRDIIQAKGEAGVGQELLCSFTTSGDTFINGETLEKIFKQIKKPIYKENILRGEVWVWKDAISGHKYIIGADISRGNSDDFSTFHIIDTNENEVVAEFQGKLLPNKFAEVLLNWAKKYNNALIVPELNNVGVVTSIILKDSGYRNLFYEKHQHNMYMQYNIQDIGPDELPGITINANNRVEMLSKLINVLNNEQLKIYSDRLYKELQTFIWKNNKPQSRKGYHDDLIMALAITNNIFEASGKNNLNSFNSNDAMAMAAAFSRNTQRINTVTGESQNSEQFSKPKRTSDGFWETPGNNNNSNSNKIHNNPFWLPFKGLIDD